MSLVDDCAVWIIDFFQYIISFSKKFDLPKSQLFSFSSEH